MYVYNALGMVVKCEFLFPQSIVSLLAIQIFKGKKSYKEEIPRVNTPHPPPPPCCKGVRRAPSSSMWCALSLQALSAPRSCNANALLAQQGTVFTPVACAFPFVPMICSLLEAQGEGAGASTEGRGSGKHSAVFFRPASK